MRIWNSGPSRAGRRFEWPGGDEIGRIEVENTGCHHEFLIQPFRRVSDAMYSRPSRYAMKGSDGRRIRIVVGDQTVHSTHLPKSSLDMRGNQRRFTQFAAIGIRQFAATASFGIDEDLANNGFHVSADARPIVLPFLNDTVNVSRTRIRCNQFLD